MSQYQGKRRRVSPAQGSWASIAAMIVMATAPLGVAETTPAADTAALTVSEAIETTRFMTDRKGHTVFVSPRGDRYAVMLIRGDVARDGVWMDLQVGQLESLEAARPRTVVRLFSSGRGAGYIKRFGADQLTTPGSNAPVWINDDSLAFFWEDAHGVRQVIAVEVDGGAVRALTQHATPVIRFGVHSSGALIYSAAIARDAPRTDAPAGEGYVVTDRDALELLSGSVLGAWDWMRHQQFVITPTQPLPRRIAFEGGERISRYLPQPASPVYSPNGHLAITPYTPDSASIPADWSRYTPDHFRSMWSARASDPDDYYARQFAKLFVVDVVRATARPLWNVPNEPLGRQQVAWSPDGRTVVLGPTFLPVDAADTDGLAAAAVAVVDIATGQFERVPITAHEARMITALRWRDSLTLECTLSDDSRLAWQRMRSGWRAISVSIHKGELAGDRNERVKGSRVPVRVEVRQDLNTPPALYAVDLDDGRSQRVLEPNPRLHARALGRVEWITDPLATGESWEGRLYWPVNYRPGQRYPLVVQTYAFTPQDEFSLYGHAGPALGPGRSAYVAQMLATRDVFVLHGPSRADSIEDLERVLNALEAQIDALVRRGLVDRTRVGIMGFSLSGWLTTYALARQRFVYAAALTDDNKDGGYFQAALSNWDFGSGEEMIGAPAFGEGLKRWLAYSPAMNVEKIHTPLLITRSSPAMALNGWELFSRLRHLNKPVEYYFIPDVEHGSHGLQNPRQLRALQERAVDWWCFWLKDERDPDQTKAEQYARWDELRRRHEADLRASDKLPTAS